MYIKKIDALIFGKYYASIYVDIKYIILYNVIKFLKIKLVQKRGIYDDFFLSFNWTFYTSLIC